jgi:cytochrome c oxidase subunit 2
MPAAEERDVVASERGWALVAGAVVVVIFVAILWAAVAMGRAPPSNGQVIDPKSLHVSGEFAEANLGTQVAADGKVTARIVAAQFQFTPSCIVLPAGRPVTLRFASPDVIHGILVLGTNVNTMVVPGYVSEVRTVFSRPGELLMPCHEYCGLAHGQMQARVKVVSPAAFRPDAQGRIACADR